MKTISVKQPYASLIVEGIKDVENRSYKTNFRGKVLIHASKNWHDRALKGLPANMFNTGQICSIPDGLWAAIENTLLYKEKNTLLTSAIIGEVTIKDCVQDSDSIWAEAGAWHWILENAKLYQHPILNIKGALSFWNFNPAALDKMEFGSINSGSVTHVLYMADIFSKPFMEGRDHSSSIVGDNLILTINEK